MRYILIAEDHPLISVGISLIVQDCLPNITTFRESTVDGILEQLKLQSMDLLILDVNIPGGGSISMIGRIRDRQPDLPILISSGISERHNAIKFLKAGVNGFISKLDTEAEYHYAINTVLSGRKYLSNSLLDYIINNLNVGLKEPMQKREHLTPMENDVLDLMLLGKQNKDISNILRLKISTVSAHRKRVLQKMDVKNLIDLVEYSNADFDLLGKR